MNVKTVIIVTLLCVGIITRYYLFTSPNKPTSDTFVVGMAAGYAPFVSVNEHGEYEGFDIDCAKALAATMNKTLILKDFGSMPSLIIALEQGTIDAIMWGMSITQDRLQRFAIVHYQGKTINSNPLIAAPSMTKPITSFADLKSLTICAEPASIQATLLEKYAIPYTPTDKVDDALLAIRYGKADAAFVERAIAQKFKSRYPELIIVDVPLEQEDYVQGVGIILKKTNASLLNNVKNAVDQLKNNGTIQEYESKWGIE
jgi:ABC-type amino acid transport substrate-binding protein